MPYPNHQNTFDIYKSGETTLEIDTMVKLVLVIRGYRGVLDEKLRVAGHGTSRMEMLSALLNMRGEVSQRDLATRLRVEDATISRMVDLLGREGLLTRSQHPTDRRVNLVSITPEGEEELRRIFRIYDQVRDHILTGFDRAEIAQLNGFATRLLARLDEPISDAIEIADLPARDRLRD